MCDISKAFLDLIIETVKNWEGLTEDPGTQNRARQLCWMVLCQLDTESSEKRDPLLRPCHHKIRL